MQFDFRKFTARAIRAYRECGGSYFTLEEALGVFRYYFARYEQAFGTPHPMISIPQIARILDKMPVPEGSVCENIEAFTPEDYPHIIDQHFATRYRNCDYNINHFFSGKIRDLRFYEVGYVAWNDEARQWEC